MKYIVMGNVHCEFALPSQQSELETLVGHDMCHWEQIVRNWGVMVCAEQA